MIPPSTHVLGQGKSIGKDISQIIYNKCTPCHQKGEAGPMLLESWKQIKGQSKLIKYVVDKGIMPPWKPDTAYSRLKNERLLSESERKAIADWIVGNGSEDFAPASTSLGKPKTTKNELTISSPYFDVPSLKKDTLMYVKVLYHLEKDIYAKSLMTLPENPQKVHHINSTFLKYPTNNSGAFFVFDVNESGKSGRDTFYKSDLICADNWVPGALMKTLPADIGYKLPSDGVLVFECHYPPSPKPFRDRIKITISDIVDTVYRLVQHSTIGSYGQSGDPYPPLIIPPDSTPYFMCTSIAKDDLTLLNFNPHMHYLGKYFEAFIVHTNGDTTHLVRIKDWDFFWQEYYVPLHPIKIEKGAKTVVLCRFDNTAANPRNPHLPPQFVKQGLKSSDEMINLNLDVVDYRNGDELMNY
ncbi:MAG: hypothetical protein JWO03_787 [Bacteroidetes bacterium]|nr:hypothetical protein [Bacteroidota bacterium]